MIISFDIFYDIYFLESDGDNLRSVSAYFKYDDILLTADFFGCREKMNALDFRGF